VVIISDGAVSDREKVFAAAAEVKRTLPPSAAVQVLPVRFITSDAAPDTKAIMAIGMLATTQVQPEDVQANDTDHLQALLRSFFESSPPLARLTAATACLCRFPGDALQKELLVRTQDHFLVHKPEDQAWETLGLTVVAGSVNMALALHCADVAAEQEIRPYLELLDNRARIGAVMGSSNLPLFALVDQLSQYLSLREEKKDDLERPGTRLRLTQIQRRLQRASTSLLNHISQLRNKGVAAAFSAQQAAAFLRRDDDSRAFAALAKRQNRQNDGQEVDLEEVARTELKALVKALPKNLPDDSLLTPSFYSCETMGDLFRGLRALTAETIDGMTLEEMLRLVGATGVPFTADHQRTLVDPWIFRPDKVHLDCTLSESDFAEAQSVGQKRGALQTPGTGRPIHGVVALGFTPEDDALLRVYRQHMPSFSTMQSSVAMMGLVSSLPLTHVALQGAALLSLAEHVTPASCTERQFTVLKMLVATLNQQTRASPYWEELRRNLTPEYFTGQNDITGALKPLLVWLEQPSLALVDELIRLETRWRVKARAKMINADGDAVLATLLDLRPEHAQPLLPPGEVDHPEDKVEFYDSVSERDLQARVQPWLTWNPQAIFTLFDLTQAPTLEAFRASPPHSISPPWLAHLVVETFQVPKLVKDKTISVPLRRTPEEEAVWVSSLVRDYYRQQYRTAVADKVRQERDLARARHLVELQHTPEMPAFLTLLKEHFAPFDGDVLPALLSLACVKRADKVWLWVLGTHAEVGDATWREGRALLLPTPTLKAVRTALSTGLDGETRLRDFNHRYKPKHTYSRDGPNRHGFSNDCPSFWALGYQTPEALYEADRALWDRFVATCRQVMTPAKFASKYYLSPPWCPSPPK